MHKALKLVGFLLLIAAKSVFAADPFFNSQLLEIAQQYETYGRVDDETRWAPYLCRAPLPSLARFSGSDDRMTHGQKLYFVFAKNRDEYLHFRPTTQPATQPVGQVIVKESWLPELVDPDTKQQPVAAAERPTSRPASIVIGSYYPVFLLGSYLPFAYNDGQLYHAKEKAGLFIMFKLDPQTAGTDQGWVYGTVTADGKTVTSAGKVESCMQCHTTAADDRTFGLGKH